MNREEYLERVYQITPRGTELPQSKLTEEAVRAIRRDWRRYSRTASAQVLANRWGVTRRTIERVLSGESWAHA